MKIDWKKIQAMVISLFAIMVVVYVIFYLVNTM